VQEEIRGRYYETTETNSRDVASLWQNELKRG